MPFVDQPDVELYQDYDFPGMQHLCWTPNRSAHVVLTAACRPEEDYRPDESWSPGYLELISAHPCRGRELIASPNVHSHTELCRHHYGEFACDDDGYIVPVVYCIPNEDEHEVHVSVGEFVARDATERPESDLLSNLEPGHLGAMNVLDLPETSEAILDSVAPTCGIPE